MKKMFMTLLVSGGIAVVVGFGFVYSGVYDVSALTPHSKPTTWLMPTTTHASLASRAADVEVPELTDAMTTLTDLDQASYEERLENASGSRYHADRDTDDQKGGAYEEHEATTQEKSAHGVAS